jgi:hypothetical protein
MTSVDREQRGGERLGREVGGQLGLVDAVGVEGEDRVAVAAVEGVEPAGTLAAGAQQGAIVEPRRIRAPGRPGR